ncbi:MAG: dihydropteroate synthase [Paraprevotella sp.]|nr:dihydropteroate synthase [Paraprevotella sp.]
MNGQMERTIAIKGKLMELSSPKVMGILNVTPDSFYTGSRKETEKEIAERTEQILSEGADFIDIGAYSSRPDADAVSAKEETARLRKGLTIVRRMAPEAIVSVDTFRADVASMCVEEYGVSLINDISGGQMNADMFDTVARLQVPYIMMHMKGTPQDMQRDPHYDNLRTEMARYFAQRIITLHERGVKDIILDPGFGFGKTLDHNYEIFKHLEDFKLFGLPLLVCISRKSMIYKLLNNTPEEALNGTTALHAMALMKGADILRVHDVRACVETVKIFRQMNLQK